jgi:hypothetical protein
MIGALQGHLNEQPRQQSRVERSRQIARIESAAVSQSAISTLT